MTGSQTGWGLKEGKGSAVRCLNPFLAAIPSSLGGEALRGRNQATEKPDRNNAKRNKKYESEGMKREGGPLYAGARSDPCRASHGTKVSGVPSSHGMTLRASMVMRRAAWQVGSTSRRHQYTLGSMMGII